MSKVKQKVSGSDISTRWIARLVAGYLRGLRPGQAAVDQPVDREHPAVERALQLQPLAHRLVGLAADGMGGGEQQGVFPFDRRQRQPAPRRLEAELFPGRFPHQVAETLDRGAGHSLARLEDRLAQLRVALAQYLGHGGGLHPRLLQQPEGLARIHRPELRRVADQPHPETRGKPEQRVHPDGVDHRGFVDAQHRTRVLLPRTGENFGVRQIGEPREEVLQRACLYPGFPLQHPRGCCGRREAMDRSLRDLTLKLIYNTSESHKQIATVIGQMWKQKLGVRTTLANFEWKTYLNIRKNREFDVARSTWCGDCNEASTFLDLLTTTHGANDGGYSSDPKSGAPVLASTRNLFGSAHRRVILEWEVVREAKCARSSSDSAVISADSSGMTVRPANRMEDGARHVKSPRTRAPKR